MIILKPFELLLSAVFNLAVNCTGHYGASLLLMSLVITLLTTPIYLLADKWSADEKRIQDAMKPEIDSIKAVYKGQKQFYLIQTTHRIHHYKFFYPLRSMLGILFQIPFFFAAYNVLSSYSGYAGVAWGKIVDLGMPDNLLFGINFLPVLMTIFNIISSFYYTKSFKLKDNKQQIILALVFLLLLYDSPSALLIYWTSNNFLSLIKNMILGKKLLPAKIRANKVDCIMLIKNKSIQLFAVDLYFFITIYLLYNKNINKYICICQTFLIGLFLIYKFFVTKRIFWNRVQFLSLFIYGVSLIIGLFGSNYFSVGLRFSVIQLTYSLVLVSFIFNNKRDYSIKVILIQSILISVLLFFLMPLRIYLLNTNDFVFSIKDLFVHISIITIVSYIILSLLFLFIGNSKIINSLIVFSLFLVLCYSSLFTINTGMLSEFSFQNADILLHSSISYYLKDIIIVLLACVFAKWFCKKNQKYIIPVLSCICLFLIFVSLYGFSQTKVFTSEKEIVQNNTEQDVSQIKLSKTGKNVVIFMADMMNGNYIPRYFEDYPEKKEIFNGFINFSDCLSISGATLNSVPALYDGENAIPLLLNGNGKLYKDELSDAMKSFYKQFLEAGYNCTNINSTLRDQLTENEVESIGKEYIEKYVNLNPYVYQQQWEDTTDIKPGIDESKLKLYLISMIPFFNIAPLSVKQIIYDDGYWCNILVPFKNNINRAKKNMALLELLPDVTVVSQENISQLIYYTTDITHEPYAINQDGDLIGSITQIDNQNFSYYSTKYFLDKLSEYIIFLKRNNLYNNTFIVVLSDHGNLEKNNEIYDMDFLHFSPDVDYRTQLRRAHSAFMYKSFYSEDDYFESNDLVQNSDLKLLLNNFVFGINDNFTILSKNQSRVRTYSFCEYLKNDYMDVDTMPYVCYEVEGTMFNSDNWKMKKEN